MPETSTDPNLDDFGAISLSLRLLRDTALSPLEKLVLAPLYHWQGFILEESPPVGLDRSRIAQMVGISRGELDEAVEGLREKGLVLVSEDVNTYRIYAP